MCPTSLEGRARCGKDPQSWQPLRKTVRPSTGEGVRSITTAILLIWRYQPNLAFCISVAVGFSVIFNVPISLTLEVWTLRAAQMVQGWRPFSGAYQLNRCLFQGSVSMCVWEDKMSFKGIQNSFSSTSLQKCLHLLNFLSYILLASHTSA